MSDSHSADQDDFPADGQDADLRELADTYPAQNAIARAGGWDAPEMDDYNDYDSRILKQSRDRTDSV